MNPSIQHRPEEFRFETTVEGQRALIAYRLANGVMTLTHTEVADPLEGRGIGGELVRAALDHARAEGLKINATCSYARAYMQRHPETMDLHV